LFIVFEQPIIHIKNPNPLKTRWTGQQLQNKTQPRHSRS